MLMLLLNWHQDEKEYLDKIMLFMEYVNWLPCKEERLYQGVDVKMRRNEMEKKNRAFTNSICIDTVNALQKENINEP